MKIKSTITFVSKKNELMKKVGDHSDTAVKQGAYIMERNVKVSATTSFVQRTGHLRRSIRTNENLGYNKAEIQINPVREGGDVNYAKYLEYGTKYIAPRAFIRNGVELARKAIAILFDGELGKVHISKINIK